MIHLNQVTAREGRPIIVCEKGDLEIQQWTKQYFEVPRTVDALQSGNFLIPNWN